jgi:hypothetical protein
VIQAVLSLTVKNSLVSDDRAVWQDQDTEFVHSYKSCVRVQLHDNPPALSMQDFRFEMHEQTLISDITLYALLDLNSKFTHMDQNHHLAYE